MDGGRAKSWSMRGGHLCGQKHLSSVALSVGLGLSFEELVTGLVIIYVWIAPKLLCLTGHKQFRNTEFTEPISKISKSSWVG